jgi:hypothetical protein
MAVQLELHNKTHNIHFLSYVSELIHDQMNTQVCCNIYNPSNQSTGIKCNKKNEGIIFSVRSTWAVWYHDSKIQNGSKM